MEIKTNHFCTSFCNSTINLAIFFNYTLLKIDQCVFFIHDLKWIYLHKFICRCVCLYFWLQLLYAYFIKRRQFNPHFCKFKYVFILSYMKKRSSARMASTWTIKSYGMHVSFRQKQCKWHCIENLITQKPCEYFSKKRKKIQTYEGILSM